MKSVQSSFWACTECVCGSDSALVVVVYLSYDAAMLLNLSDQVLRGTAITKSTLEEFN